MCGTRLGPGGTMLLGGALTGLAGAARKASTANGLGAEIEQKVAEAGKASAAAKAETEARMQAIVTAADRRAKAAEQERANIALEERTMEKIKKKQQAEIEQMLMFEIKSAQLNKEKEMRRAWRLHDSQNQVMDPGSPGASSPPPSDTRPLPVRLPSTSFSQQALSMALS